MQKKHSRLNSLLHSLPSFNKSDRLSIKVAHLLNVEENTPDEDMSFTVDRRRCSPHRRSLGGRGREWASESLKLLEALLELDDSKPVREPVNPLQYPEYYSRVPNPLDLSKIMLKFHGGSYATLEAFSRDMRNMFNNYKAFFKDANSEIYTQVHRLSWWFEAELTRIDDKWGRIRRPPIVVHSAVTDITKSAEQPEQAHDPMMPVISNPRSIQNSDEPYYDGPELRKKRKKPRKQLRVVAADISVQETSDEPGSSSVPQPAQGTKQLPVNLDQNSGQGEPFPVSLARLKPGTVAQLLGTKRTLVSSSKGSGDGSNQMETEPMESQRPDEDCSAGTSKAAPGSKVPRVPRLHLDTLTLPLNVSNIWFGMARIKPKKEAMLTETGLQISLHCGDVETPFTIHADEMVRCVAHFGRTSHKHTLFLFVLPSCSKRLEAVNQKYSNSSMIVIFINSSTFTQISTLVHIFWNIGRNSLFGPIFSEVDQQGALMLLGNIKPGIMNRVADKYKTSHSTSQSVLVNERSGQSSIENALPIKRRKVSQDLAPNYQILPDQNGSGDDTGGEAGSSHHERADGPQAEPESSVMPDSSVSVGQEEQQEDRQNPSVQHFDKDFAERLGASLQRGFKDGFTEVIKNLTDSLYGKRLPQENMSPDNNGETDAAQDGGSDIEIVIPTDSEEDEKPGSPAAMEENRNEPEGEDLAVTKLKPRIRCPITQQVMKRPLRNVHCNHCYDMQGVEQLIKNRKQKARCPVAGCSNMTPLHMMDMKYDHALWKYIQEKVNPDPLDLSGAADNKEADSS